MNDFKRIGTNSHFTQANSPLQNSSQKIEQVCSEAARNNKNNVPNTLSVPGDKPSYKDSNNRRRSVKVELPQLRRLSIADYMVLHNDNKSIKPPLYNTQKLKSKFVVSNLAGLKTMKSLKRVVKVSKEEWKHGEISKSPIANFEKILNRKSNSNDSSPIDLSAKLKANKEAAKNITKSMTKITEANSCNNESSDKQGSIADIHHEISGCQASKDSVYISKVITDLNEFFEVAGLSIITQDDNEIHLKINHKGINVKIDKFMFTKFKKESSKSSNDSDSSADYNIYVDPLADIKNDAMEFNLPNLSSRKVVPKSTQPIQTPNIEKASEVQGTKSKANIKKPEPKGKPNFADILNNLQDMSEDSTLFGGIDDDDDAPPPMFQAPSKFKKNEEQDQSQTHQISDTSRDLIVINNANQKEIDPFDFKNFHKSTNSQEMFGYDISKLRSFNIDGDKIFNPLKEIQKLKEEVRIKNEEILRLNMKFQHKKTSDTNTSIAASEAINGLSNYHLAFLFASPLVRKINTNIEMIMQLDYQNEIKSIEK